jgi:hypothetical protein
VNALEEYIVAHELGHLTLGHITAGHTRQLSPPKGNSFQVIGKSEFQEFQADMWACRTLIMSARKRNRTDSDVALAVAGLSMGLGIGLMVEASANKHGIRLADGHPPARERLYMAQVGYELFGAHDEAFIARRFYELLEEVIAFAYPNTKLPPLLDRDLNSKMMKTLDSLKIDYSNVPYLTNFS